ncbi:hypothetical protein [Sphingomicrobium aestuariivivum]|uniref:hypothetical protein n=1 Tax=Sphingomicrobium aestuariivivum TaxID=1582356 RepID=UPI001FD682DF|nr:hypothetical protein [Sphingomicrobium aestuariivivum]MCJ8191338.1 hypothetical protein [Sphingomicrobium aestuariivivum]
MTLTFDSRLIRPLGWGLALALLLAPAVAMQFSDEVRWGPGDFVIFAMLLGLVGLAVELIVARIRSGSTRALAIIAALLGFLYIWAELAVGIFTNLGS